MHKKILIIGVGKVTELVLKYLKKEGPEVIFVSNRTFRKAKELAGYINASAVRFDNLKDLLKKADIVITATASPCFIIRKETIKGVNQRLLIVDLAVPRDVDPRIKDKDNIELFDLEGLSGIIQENFKKRRLEAQKAETIINREIEKTWHVPTGSEPEQALSL